MYRGNATLPGCLNWYDVQFILYDTAIIDLSFFPDESWETIGSKCR